MEPRQEDRMGLHTRKFGLHAAGTCEKAGWRNSPGFAHSGLAFRDHNATGDPCADAIERIAEADTDIAHAHAFTEHRRAAIANKGFDGALRTLLPRRIDQCTDTLDGLP
jgi:hypothetical protein